MPLSREATISYGLAASAREHDHDIDTSSTKTKARRWPAEIGLRGPLS
ncbi:hypothetical protein [Microbacterium sorbitolivorans]|nr:hypothetical protein [Microbacterium sorbitolivorans]